MDWDFVQTMLRMLLKVGGGVLVTKGLTDQSGAEALAAGVLVLVGMVWSRIHQKKLLNTPPPAAQP